MSYESYGNFKKITVLLFGHKNIFKKVFYIHSVVIKYLFILSFNLNIDLNLWKKQIEISNSNINYSSFIQ